MATRCPLPADHGYLTHLDGSVTLTRPCEDMEPAALMDLKAALTLLGDRAVNLRLGSPLSSLLRALLFLTVPTS